MTGKATTYHSTILPSLHYQFATDTLVEQPFVLPLYYAKNKMDASPMMHSKNHPAENF